MSSYRVNLSYIWKSREFKIPKNVDCKWTLICNKRFGINWTTQNNSGIRSNRMWWPSNCSKEIKWEMVGSVCKLVLNQVTFRWKIIKGIKQTHQSSKQQLYIPRWLRYKKEHWMSFLSIEQPHHNRTQNWTKLP